MNDDHWTYLAVRTLLGNARYRGQWEYGKKMAVWQVSKDYVRQVPRDQALRTMQIEELRIIDDETFFTAQKELHEYRERVGRRPKNGNIADYPKDLNGRLFCGKHDRLLTVCGPHGKHLGCPVCRRGRTISVRSHCL